jgi:signal transduction histidine kinase
MRPSLALRLAATAALGMALVLVMAGLAVAVLLRDFVTERFEDQLDGVVLSLVAATEVDEDGEPALAARPADSRFAVAGSGWQWQVSDDVGVIAQGPEPWEGAIAPADPAGSGRTSGPIMAPDGRRLFAVARAYRLPDLDLPLVAMAAMPAERIEAETRRIALPLAVGLAVLVIGLGAAMAVQIRLGLAPLRALTDALAEIRRGRRRDVPEGRHAELVPLGRELNLLLEENRAVIARARDHIDRLAHALKTDLAALAASAPQGAVAGRAIARMNRLIDLHLARARARAGRPRATGSVAVAPVLADLAAMLERISARRVTVEASGDLSFPGEQGDLEEMVGNLADNACRWARSRVEIVARCERGRLRISIRDDGPGLGRGGSGENGMAAGAGDGSHAAAAGGGAGPARDDGTGLGLVITADLARLHGGTLRLEEAEGGGLVAELDLPAGPSSPSRP